MKQEEMKTLIKELMDHSNIMSPECNISDVLFDIVSGTHRTIQQSFVKELHDFLIKYSELNHDARNEKSIDFAKKVKDLDLYFPFV